MAEVLFSILVGVTLFSLLVLLAVPFLFRPSREYELLMKNVANGRLESAPPTGTRERFEVWFANFVTVLRRKLGVHLSRKSKDDLQAAGYRSERAADGFLAVQCLAPLAGIFAASFFQDNLFFRMIALGALGYLAPNLWLSSRVRKRRETIRRGLPDAMDLLVICVDAGLGLDQALLRVSEDLSVSHPVIQDEFSRVHLEQRAGIPRLEAWKHMAARVQVPEITTFVSMLMQTERFGTPISRALSNYAEELRGKRRQRAEEAAAKTKVKIVFPLVFFIFPCLFIVLLAPAMLEMTKMFKQIGP